MNTMKLISWNVNGLRSALKKGFVESVMALDADVLCLQETRALPEQVDIELPGYRAWWNPAEKRGYSGVAVWSRHEPEQVHFGMGIPEHDSEGRVLTLEFAEFFLVTVYTPNAGRGLVRLDYRMRWDADFLAHMLELEKRKPVVFCGDLNVAHKEIDLKNPKSNVKNAGFTPEERAGFDRIIASGFIDTFREFEKGGGHYTWWSHRFNARARNIGWRIDYFCISAGLRPLLREAFILPEVYGSDHCPVGIVMSTGGQG